MLAGQVWVARTLVEPGEHEVRILIQGPGFATARNATATVPEGGIAVVVITEPR